MKILFVCHRFPFPPDRGGKIRSFHMIQHLSQKHEVVVASLTRSDGESRAGQGLAEHCQQFVMGRVREPWQTLRMIARLPLPEPSSMGYFYSRKLEQAIKKTLAEQSFDLIIVHCSSVAQYVEDIKGIPKILDFGDMDSQKWLIYSQVRRMPLSWGYWFEGSKMERAEKHLAKKFDLCTCTTKAEIDTLNSYQTGVASDWFPNGVDFDYFSPGDSNYGPDTLCFIGRMDYYPNQVCMFEFCNNTLPFIQRQRPNTKLLIIGANPSPKVLKLGQRPGVTVTGSVPDVRPYVRQSAVMIAPLNIARGTQNKILEAMAMGTPVITSELAGGGVDAIPEEHFLTASTSEGYAKVVIELLGNPTLRAHYAIAGRQRMKSHHHWPNSMAKLDRIIENCIENF